jgi:hypothetical protein
MDFITKFPRTAKQHDSIMVVVDKLTKAAHFIPVNFNAQGSLTLLRYTCMKLLSCMVYLRQLCLIKIPSSPRTFGKGYSKGFGTSMNFSTTYHPESDGQTERVNRVIEDMLRMYVMDNPSKWEGYLHLVEFDYKNGYQASLKMIPFETLYGRKCNMSYELGQPSRLHSSWT